MASIIMASVISPIICALAIALVAGWLRRASGTWRDHIGWEGALLLVSIAACHLALVGWNGFPPTDVKFWPIVVAVAAIPLAAMANVILPWSARYAVALLIIGGASVLLLRPELTAQGASDNAILVVVVLAGWFATYWSWSSAAAASTPGELLTAVLVTTGLTAFGLLLFGSFTYAQVVGILGFSLAVLALMHWLGGMSRTGAVSVAVAAGIVLPMWWILGVTMADLPRWAPPLLLVAGASSWLTAIPAIGCLASWKRIACVAVVASALAAPVIICGVKASLPAAGGSHASDGY